MESNVVPWNCCSLDDITAPLCVSLLHQRVIKSKCCGPLTQHPYASSGGAQRPDWIMLAGLMSCRCRLTADCFMSWMDGVQPRQPSAAGFCQYQPAPRCCLAFFMRCVMSEVISLDVGFIRGMCRNISPEAKIKSALLVRPQSPEVPEPEFSSTG